MPFEMRADERGSTLVLSGKLSVQQARPLWDALRAAAALQRAVLLQAGDVEEIDTSIAQILCRAVNQGAQLQGGASDGLLVSLQRRGLEKFFIQSPTASEVPERGAGADLAPDAGQPAKRRSAPKSTKSSKGRVRHG